MPGMREVAREAGVSLSTVSAVLSGSEKYVSEEIRNKVLLAANKIGYRCPAKKKKAEKVIAVVLPNITSTFFSSLLSGIEDTATDEGYTLVFGNSGYHFSKERRFISMIQKQSLQGVMIDTVCPITEENAYFEELRRTFGSKDIPVILLERKIQEPNFGSVYVDHMNNAYQATKHLVQKGYRSIAHVAGKANNPLTVLRLNGYRKVLEEGGIPYDKELVASGDFSPNSGYIAMKKILGIRSDCMAVFAANDQMAIGAMKAILSEGKRVPEDIAVVGIDNLSVSSMISPSLTTINVPTYQMGRTAVKLLMDRSKEKRRSVKLPCNLIVRRSTDLYAGSEWDMFGW